MVWDEKSERWWRVVWDPSLQCKVLWYIFAMGVL
jgi:hypothetical protein